MLIRSNLPLLFRYELSSQIMQHIQQVIEPNFTIAIRIIHLENNYTINKRKEK